MCVAERREWFSTSRLWETQHYIYATQVKLICIITQRSVATLTTAHLETLQDTPRDIEPHNYLRSPFLYLPSRMFPGRDKAEQYACSYVTVLNHFHVLQS